MAGGSGKYNRHLIEELARGAQAGASQDHPADASDRAGVAASAAGPAGTATAFLGAGEQLGSPSSSRPRSRHVWVVGPPEDPGPHAGVLVGNWVRGSDGVSWCAQVIWYSQDADVVVQQSLPAAALRPALE